MKRRLAQLPLHGGKAPPWLFKRMTKLAGAITMGVVDACGTAEMLARLADPWWFQAFGCVLGFDWHSSGLTTVTCGALKEAARYLGDDLGIYVAGGKANAGRKAPEQIGQTADRLGLGHGQKLVYASKMSAKVDSAAVQDGYRVYHHTFFFSSEGSWCVVQQGMNASNRYARRYHWLGNSVDDFVCEPHAGLGDLGGPTATEQELMNDAMPLLNMVACEAEANRDRSAALVRQNPDKLLADIAQMTEGPTLFAPSHHPVLPSDTNLARLGKIVRRAHERHPQDFETLLGTPTVGPATIRSLSLLAELIYKAPASHRDPAQAPDSSKRPDGRRWADYSYAHEGKDGQPFPVDRATYDHNIVVLSSAVRQARMGQMEKTSALRRLARIA